MSIDPPEREAFSEKSTVPPKKWDYETLKEYLLAQARGEKFLLPLNQFPKELDLGNDWHNILNTMRDKSNQDRTERIALVGYNTRQRAIYLPTEGVAAKKLGEYEWNGVNPVNPLLIQLQQAAAFIAGIEGFAGILHSHPTKMQVLGRVFNLHGGRLSAGDLYAALIGKPYGVMIGVADGRINSLAFKTRDSIVPSDSQKDFYDLWERDPQPRNLDQVIAEKYKIALYKGYKNESLKRISPK